MAAQAHDPYQTLGVSPSATQDEIKTAYRNLAKKFHPDLNPGNKQAEKRFKEISHAYDLVGTKKDRDEYERLKTERDQAERWNRAQQSERGPFYYETQEGEPGGRYSAAFGAGEAGGFDADIFETLFRQSRGRRHQPPPVEEEIYELAIEPRDAIQGAQTVFTLPSGKKLSVKIPAGVASGTKLRFAKQGTHGDVFVQLRVSPTEHFKIEGGDLVSKLPVSIIDAILGSEVSVPTADGTILLHLPKHVNSGQRIRVPGKGLFEKTGGKRGDQIYFVELRIPETLSPEMEAAARHEKEHQPRKAS